HPDDELRSPVSCLEFVSLVVHVNFFPGTNVVRLVVLPRKHSAGVCAVRLLGTLEPKGFQKKQNPARHFDRRIRRGILLFLYRGSPQQILGSIVFHANPDSLSSGSRSSFCCTHAHVSHAPDYLWARDS